MFVALCPIFEKRRVFTLLERVLCVGRVIITFPILENSSLPILRFIEHVFNEENSTYTLECPKMRSKHYILRYSRRYNARIDLELCIYTM